MINRYFSRDDSERDVPMLNTSSLPDLIFTVLFFFMIVTHMREVTLKVHYEVPQGTEIQKLGHKASIVQIYVGRQAGSDEFRIQLNNQLSTIDDIKAERRPVANDRQHQGRPRRADGHDQRHQESAAAGLCPAHQLFGHRKEQSFTLNSLNTWQT